MAIALVNQATKQQASGVTTTVVTVPSTSAGNALVLAIGQAAASTGIQISSITDNVGATWVVPASMTTATDGPPPVDLESGANSNAAFAYALNIPAGITTITITWAANCKANGVIASEWSGVATASAVDVTAHGGGASASTSHTATALTTTNANDLVIYAINAPTASSVLPSLQNGSSSPSSGWTALTGVAETTAVALGAAYQVFSATGTYDVNWTIGTSAKAGMVGIALQAAAGGGTNWSQPVDDTVSLADATAFDRGLALTESLSLADAQAFARGLSLSESLSLADARAFARGLSLSDSLALVDAITISRGSHLSIADSVTLSDAFHFNRGLGLSESVALADALAFHRGLTLSESLALTDAITPVLTGGGTHWTQAVNDSVALADALALHRGLSLAETVTLADSISFKRALHFSDAVTLVDGLALHRGLGLADTVALADSVGLGRKLTISEVVTVADALARGQAKHLNDAVTVADAVNFLFNGQPLTPAQSAHARTIFVTKFGFYT